jgi:hypothetical protein
MFADFKIAFLDQEGDEDDDSIEIRNKRQAEQYEYTPTKTRCPLLLVADYRFYQEMGGSNTKTTINYLVRIVCYNSLVLNVYECFHVFIWILGCSCFAMSHLY